MIKFIIFASIFVLANGQTNETIQCPEQLSGPLEDIYFQTYNKTATGIKNYTLDVKNATQIKSIFSDTRLTVIQVYFHDYFCRWDDPWIMQSKDMFLSGRFVNPYVIISINYTQFVKAYEQTRRNMETLAKIIGKKLILLLEVLSDRSKQVEFYGNGIGANIASMTAAVLIAKNANYKPVKLGALDPEFFYLTDFYDLNWCYEPQETNKSIDRFLIKKTNFNRVHVLFTSICNPWGIEDYYKIEPICNPTSEVTMGHEDYYANGGLHQPGCRKNDFDCYRARAPELFVEANGGYIYQYKNRLLAYRCLNYRNFTNGLCKTCTASCAMDFKFYNNPNGRYHFHTNDKAPFTRQPNSNFTPPFNLSDPFYASYSYW